MMKILKKWEYMMFLCFVRGWDEMEDHGNIPILQLRLSIEWNHLVFNCQLLRVGLLAFTILQMSTRARHEQGWGARLVGPVRPSTDWVHRHVTYPCILRYLLLTYVANACRRQRTLSFFP